MSESPSLKPTQADMLRALIDKRGWTLDEFTQHAGRPVEQLTRAEARTWIAKLTKQTKGKARPQTTTSPPAAAQHHKSPLPEPEPAPAPARPVPTPEAVQQATLIIQQQLGLADQQTAVVPSVLREVGIEAGLAVLDVIVNRADERPAMHRVLTPLEQWVVLTRQLTR